MRRVTLGLIFFFFFFQLSGLMAETTSEIQSEGIKPLSFGEAYIEEYLSDESYQYVELDDGENWYEKLKRKINQAVNKFISWLIGDGKLGKFGNFIVQALPYIAVLLLSVLLLWVITKYEVYPTSDKKINKSKVGFTDDEAVMQRQDIQDLIEAAIAQGDFRLAVRYSYLSILKKMMEQSLIDWKIQKTNHDYIKELPEGMLKTGFTSITRIYDYIWYGGFELDQSSFDAVKRSFHQVEEAL